MLEKPLFITWVELPENFRLPLCITQIRRIGLRPAVDNQSIAPIVLVLSFSTYKELIRAKFIYVKELSALFPEFHQLLN